MKKIIKYFGILTIILTITSCEEEEWLAPDIEITNVYSITNITGLDVVKINVYKEKPLIIEYATDVVLNNYNSSNFINSSTDTNIEFSVNKISGDSTISYAVIADKTTGNGTLTINDTSEYAINVSEIEVYN
ncbi:hypothetical protein MHL31_05685 [Lutibacter sp. A80]|uniref:hypothetical protein n=1 Tax=Lutibacter sp. A80 TaxID=2918453 RepID=UPI001F06DCBE|nr:hypothetical protein [Lutibacter sp. A80]UMB61694.1 hypothetical protein MHL31_05685 [Lutibacter sp. A80]